MRHQPIPEPEVFDSTLGPRIGWGLAWSFLNNAIGRAGSFLVGILMARILVPEDFGIYAIALVVLNIMLSMNELGVSLALIREEGSLERIAPTIFTISLMFSTVLFIAMWFGSPYLTGAMGDSEATGVVRLLSFGVLLDGVAAVPAALMTRSFMQRQRMMIDTLAFTVSTPVSICLALAGYGAWSLAWGALIGNAVSGGLTVVIAPKRYSPGFDRREARQLLRFGAPLAAASLLLFLMLNVDYVVTGTILGVTALGLYTLAFNLCSWPVTLVSTAIRRVSMSGFSRFAERGKESEGFRQAVFLVLALTVPVAVLLASYASELVGFLYGSQWLPAAEVIPFLAVLGIARVVVELSYDYLVALGRTTSNLWLHAVWLAVLIPALIFGARAYGIVGVGMGQAATAIFLVSPVLALVLHRARISVILVLRDSLLPLAGGVAIILTSFGVHEWINGAFWQLSIGGLVGLGVYVAIVGRRARTTTRALFSGLDKIVTAK